MEIDSMILKKIDYDPQIGVLRWNDNAISRQKGKIAGSMKDNGYLSFQISGKRLYCHRVAWFIFYGYWPEGDIDHINRNKSDNSIRNLRCCTRSMNCGNTRKMKGKSSKYKGVSKYRDGRWMAQIRRNGKQWFLGYHQTEIGAAMAYAKASGVVFNEFKNHPGVY